MKFFAKLLAGILLLAGLSAPAFAQATANVNATATTKIVVPISIAFGTNLAFGTVVRPAAAGANSVIIDATTGVRSTTGSGVQLVTASASGRATYTVTGEPSATFTISVPTGVSMTSGANTIPVTLTPSSATGTIGVGGTVLIGVGGSFAIANTQASGSYTLTFATTVTYN